MKLTIHEVVRVVDAKNDVTNYADNPLVKAEFDSRLIGAGDLFVPLKGARDGHDFIETAFENGAAVTLSEKEVADHPYILVDDVLTAFQALAAYYLQKTGVDVFAVTGSNGKTTTKDMLAHLLSTSYKTYKTQGNYNNEIGLPYTVLHMPDTTEKLVLEMGQDHLGDIHLLSELARPKTAIVTLVGEAHLAFFKDRSEIAKGKLQIADGMEKGGLLLAPADPIVEDYLPTDKKVVRFGPGAELEITDLIERKDSLTNATNAMIASYVALQEGVTEEQIHQAFQNLELTRNRTEWKKATNGADILSDVYNANPTAMKLILETFSAIPANEGGKKLAVLADMKELGDQSVQLHNQMILSITPDVLDTVIFYGEDIADLAQLASQMFPIGHVYYFKKTAEEDQFEAMVKQVKESLGAHDQILLKGSNSMNLAKLVESLENEHN